LKGKATPLMSTTKRKANPLISAAAQKALEQYETYVRQYEDVNPTSLRNYLCDLRHFAAWYEESTTSRSETEVRKTFQPTIITTPTLTRYRAYLQMRIKPASVNRALISLKRYFSWVVQSGLLEEDPSKPVKMVMLVEQAPRHLSGEEEEALVAAVNQEGSLRDRTLVILLLHTGLRASEVCLLKREQVEIAGRKGSLTVVGKGNKYREVPLNATARKVLSNYLTQLGAEAVYVFPSEKTGKSLSERALGHLIKKYADKAKLKEVSPHDLRHRFGYRMAQQVPLHRLAQIMGHASLDTTRIYIRGTKSDLQREVEKIAWV
jgi:integrase/recombinase XerD